MTALLHQCPIRFAWLTRARQPVVNWSKNTEGKIRLTFSFVGNNFPPKSQTRTVTSYNKPSRASLQNTPLLKCPLDECVHQKQHLMKHCQPVWSNFFTQTSTENKSLRRFAILYNKERLLTRPLLGSVLRVTRDNWRKVQNRRKHIAHHMNPLSHVRILLYWTRVMLL